MFEIHVTVDCPDLVAAATTFANALAGIKSAGNPTVLAAPMSAQIPATPVAQPVPAPVAPVNPTQTTYPSTHSMPTSYPSNTAPVTAAPVAQAPAFTLEQVSKAGADLITAQPAKMQELMALLQQYGVQTIQALPADKLGAFATALRGMGAQI